MCWGRCVPGASLDLREEIGRRIEASFSAPLPFGRTSVSVLRKAPSPDRTRHPAIDQKGGASDVTGGG